MNYKKDIKKLFIKLFARKMFQSFFKQLHWIALRGMNYGAGYSPYDSGEIFFLHYVKKNSPGYINVLDVGANTGQYTLLCNQIFQKDCRIFSFEPTKHAFKKLEKNTNFSENILLYNFGMGEVNKKSKIYYSRLGSVQSSLFQDDGAVESENINLWTIDEFCEEHDIKHITILKLDVEGYEYKVLAGAKNSIKNVDYIQFEFGNKQVDSRNFLKDFITILSNFKIYRLIQDGLVEVNSNPINEIFQTSNYVAINRNLL
jgi:FkbM family methyltransferase